MILWLETVSKSSFWRTTESHWQREVPYQSPIPRLFLPPSLSFSLSPCSSPCSFPPLQMSPASIKHRYKTLIRVINPLLLSPFSHPCSWPVRADLHSWHWGLWNWQHEVHAERRSNHWHHGWSQCGDGRGGRRGQLLHLRHEGGWRGCTWKERVRTEPWSIQMLCVYLQLNVSKVIYSCKSPNTCL